jgi:hypothetical protein
MSETTQQTPTQTSADRLRAQYNWRKVHTPLPWRPDAIGEELVGFYGGKSLRDGPHGQYEVVLVHVPLDWAYQAARRPGLRGLNSATPCVVGAENPNLGGDAQPSNPRPPT